MEEKVKAFVRLANTDLNGNRSITQALTKIHGISHSLAHALCNTLEIDDNKKAGALTDTELDKLKKALENIAGLFPLWMLNRRKDRESNLTKHNLGPELKLQREFDIKFLKKIKCYKGARHATGQPVRGQRTRAHFRTGITVGVVKKKVLAQQQPDKGKDKGKDKDKKEKK